MKLIKPFLYFFLITTLSALISSCDGEIYDELFDKACTLAYDGNSSTGGTIPSAPVTYREGQVVTVLDNTGTLARTGYIFGGWNTEPDGTGTTYTAGSAFIIGKTNMVLYALWTTTAHYIYSDLDLYNVRNALGDDYILMSDIDLSVNYSSGWTPIGSGATPFTGNFYGNNHTISNITISSAADYQGLFGYTSGATIQELDLTGVSVTGGSYVGSLAGYSTGSTISNCSVPGGSVSGNNTVGGLIGENSGGTLTNCSSSSSVTGILSNPTNIGGLAGINSGTADYCYNTGTVTGYYNVGGLIGVNSGAITNSHTTSSASVNGSLYCGGLIGWNSAGGTLDNCYAENTVSGGTFDTGGLIGRNYADITSCYATGNVSGNTNVGGLIGLNYIVAADVTLCYSTGNASGGNVVGGFIGQQQGICTNCYSRGNATGTSSVGGFVGWNQSGAAINYCYETGLANAGSQGGLIGTQSGTCSFSYFNSANTGNAYGIPETLANMQIQATFTGWDFAATWSIGVLNGGYPYLTAIPP